MCKLKSLIERLKSAIGALATITAELETIDMATRQELRDLLDAVWAADDKVDAMQADLDVRIATREAASQSVIDATTAIAVARLERETVANAFDSAFRPTITD